MRDLDQQAGAVTALAVGVEPAPVGKPRERLDAERDRFVARLGRGHETHAACGPVAGEVPRPRQARWNQRWGHCPQRLLTVAGWG